MDERNMTNFGTIFGLLDTRQKIKNFDRYKLVSNIFAYFWTFSEKPRK